ncbi:MAG: hypothetical protein A2X59_13170 [Nitrospirae bacterium GWC2_42_7]|nr:MAG: hypothetical protein A2X59_13170 [Nitrospirae bacterium GWC2_42_7]
MLKKYFFLILTLAIAFIFQSTESFSENPSFDPSIVDQSSQKILTVNPADIKNKKNKAYDVIAALNKGIIKEPAKQIELNSNSEKQTLLPEKYNTDEKVSWEIFERRRRFYHPYLIVTTFFTDNVLNTKDKKQSDLITVVSPGIWLSMPSMDKRLSLNSTSNRTPGGYLVENLGYDLFRRFQAYLAYQADIELFSKYSGENAIRHKAEALVQYRLGSRIILGLMDQYQESRDDRGTEISGSADKVSSNLLSGAVNLEVGTKLLLKAGYSNNHVNYSGSANAFRDRVDNAFNVYVHYKIRPKLSLFGEYEFVDIKYGRKIELIDEYGNPVLGKNGKPKKRNMDSTEQHYFGGIQWDITSKSQGIFKAGYGKKEFASTGVKGSRDIILEANINHRLTTKTSLAFKVWRKTNETDMTTTSYILSKGMSLGYTQKLTNKLTGSIDLSYIADQYKGIQKSSVTPENKEDKYYRLGLGFQYEFRRWLTTALGYTHTIRDSNPSADDYSNNTFYFRVTGSM